MNELKEIINKAIKEFLKTTDYTTVFGKMEKDIVAWHKREVEKLNESYKQQIKMLIANELLLIEKAKINKPENINIFRYSSEMLETEIMPIMDTFIDKHFTELDKELKGGKQYVGSKCI